MSKDKKNHKAGAGSNGQAPDTTLDSGIDPHGSDSPNPESTTPRSWALKLPRYKVPTEYGLKLITAEVLAADPDLLDWLVANHPDCFKTLPAPAETNE